jgi:hypothetical protein
MGLAVLRNLLPLHFPGRHRCRLWVISADETRVIVVEPRRAVNLTHNARTLSEAPRQTGLGRRSAVGPGRFR